MIANILTPRFVREDGSRTYRWGEWSPKISGPRLDLTNLGGDDGHLTLIIGLVLCTFYVKVPVRHNWEMWEEGLGFYFSDDALVLEWPWPVGKQRKTRLFLPYPWAFDFYKRWELVEDVGYMSSDGAWLDMPRSARHGLVATEHVYDFEYVLKSGEVQRRKATVYVDRMEWRRRWLPWTSMFNKVMDCINVSFDDEVGERTGSWKGGCTGCGYELLPGESAEACLARMGRERKFT